MSAFGAGLSASKLRHMDADEIEDTIIKAAHAQVDKKDCSELDGFLQDDFAVKTFAQWASSKFDIKLKTADLEGLKLDQVQEKLTEIVADKYNQREIEYPVEFAMSMAFGQQSANIYGMQALADWANKRYNAGLDAEKLQETKPKKIYDNLLELSKKYHDGYLEEMISEKVKSGVGPGDLAEWSNESFNSEFTESDLADSEEAEAKILEAGREFLRQELSDLERYVLLQIYDGTWKDHLYAMDHLKESIFLRAFAEKDPKIEYKQEGFRMFNEMLEVVEDKVSDTIFKVRLEAGARTRNVWNVSKTQHDEVSQFAQTERQRAAGTAPQGEQKVKQITLDQPKVGRNDPCICGSGKKFKKCCGKNS